MIKTFSLGLIYPAVLGSMLVLLFTRVANAGLESIVDYNFLFGVLVLIFYCFGFVYSSHVQNYDAGNLTIDVTSSVLIFICYFVLGLSAPLPPDPASLAAIWVVYVVLFSVTASPVVYRRLISFTKHTWSCRDTMSIIGAIVCIAGVLRETTSFLSFVSPYVVLFALAVLIVAYAWDVSVRGLLPE